MSEKKFLSYSDEVKLRERLEAAGSIKQILDIINQLEGYIPARAPDGFILKDLAPGNLRLNIERIRHGHESIGEEPPKLDPSDLLGITKAEVLEKILPNYAGIRENVRRLLAEDPTYKRAMERMAKKTERKMRFKK